MKRFQSHTCLSSRRFTVRIPPISYFIVLILGLFQTTGGFCTPGPDTSKNVIVNIISAKNSYGLQTDSGMLQRMVENVQLQQGETLMTCDSAYLNLATNNMQAFGNVHITQPGGTQVSSDYLRYTGNKKMAFLRGNVSLTDGKNNLWSDELSYDVAAKTGTYANGGTLQSDATTLSSNTGIYNTRTKEARFKGDVMVNDPQYDVSSEDLGYNTNTKMVTFFGPSLVTNDKSELHTSRGTYDSKQEIAHFTSRSSMMSESQYIEGDKLDYNRVSGFGKASGKVIAIDTSKHATLWSEFAAYNEKTKILFATGKPVLRNVNGKDSLYIRADTFFSAPQKKHIKPVTSLKSGKEQTAHKGKKQRMEAEAPAILESTDGTPVDTTAPRYYIGYHHVRIWSDSLQGVCDSISYSTRDSVMKMMGGPVAWSRESQITGDTILLFVDTSSIKRLYVPANALIVSRSGPAKAQLYDQVQGKTLNGYFKNNQLDYMVVFPAAESIYYAKDDSGAYLGVNQAESERMKVFFKDSKISRIIFEQEVKQKMTPIEKANIAGMKLSRFQWLDAQRPKSKQELFERTTGKQEVFKYWKY